jgi:hypothetical protein
MKKIILLILVSFLAKAQNSKLDDKNGFDNYKFGTAPGEYKNLALEIDEGNVKLFSLEKCSIKLNDVEFQNVNITFVKNKLSAISLRSKNSGGIKLLQVLKENYGEPNKSNAAKGSYEWLSAKVELLYEKQGSSKEATISFSSKDIYNNKGK